VYGLVSRGIRERSDAWLKGEAEVLADVSGNTPRDSLYDRMMEEVAEHASREVPDAGSNHEGQRKDSVFFLLTRPAQEPLWVGPEPRASFFPILQGSHLPPNTPASFQFSGYGTPFRVVSHPTADGGNLYLGFADVAASRFLRKLTERFLLLWVGMTTLGFCITSFAAYRTLARVQHITDAVAQIGTDDLASRLPEAAYHDEIARLSRTFNRMLERIQASVHQVRVLTDSIAHDLKSPVTTIRGTLEEALLKDDHTWRETVGDAVERLDRLSQLLNNALDLSEAHAGALQLRREPIELTALMQQIIEIYQPVLADRDHVLSFQPEDEAVVDADPSLLNRTIANLMDNEVAHLPAGCRIWIAVRKRDDDGEIVIQDDGPGFPPELRSRAFERFVKGVNSSGHGLGLAFVDAVVQAHGGNVQISDREGQGARIAVSFPLATVGSKTEVKS
jgi:signal transduction histidine kinase